MRFSTLFRQQVLFLLMAAIWGATWIAMKIGVAAVPPVLFAGTRFAAAGLLLLAWRGLWGACGTISRRDWPRVGLVALLMVAATYAPLFWAMQYVPSGLAATIDFALIPVALLGFAVLMHEEAFDRSRAIVVGIGSVGIVCLFWSSVFGHGDGGTQKLFGAVAIVLSVAAYCWGSVLARPLLRAYPPALIAGTTNLLGGAMLVSGALSFETGALASLATSWSAAVWLSWAYLVLFGSVGGFTIYLLLIRDWGPSRAGAYAFVSPVIAVALGMLVLGERVGMAAAAGTILMLSAAMLALRERRGAPSIPVVFADPAAHRIHVLAHTM
jgi:drug/metabolite transporter (DMT)-like permease